MPKLEIWNSKAEYEFGQCAESNRWNDLDAAARIDQYIEEHPDYDEIVFVISKPRKATVLRAQEDLEMQNGDDQHHQLLAYKPFSAHPADRYLGVALVKLIGSVASRKPIEYVIWTYNADTGGFGDGKYSQDLLEALEFFDKKGGIK